MIGHSQGGMLAPRIDAEGGDFAELVIMGGTLRSLDEIIIDQNEDSTVDSAVLEDIAQWILSLQHN